MLPEKELLNFLVVRSSIDNHLVNLSAKVNESLETETHKPKNSSNFKLIKLQCFQLPMISDGSWISNSSRFQVLLLCAMDILFFVWLLSAAFAGFILWAAFCKAFYSIRGEFGKKLVRQEFDHRSFHVVEGDYTTNLIYEEIFVEKVYFKRHISLDKERPTLVIDVGGNHGFFSAFVAEHFEHSRLEHLQSA